MPVFLAMKELRSALLFPPIRNGRHLISNLALVIEMFFDTSYEEFLAWCKNPRP